MTTQPVEPDATPQHSQRQQAGPPKPAGEPEGGSMSPVRVEQLIGGQLFAAVGALIVVAGLGFAARLAWNAGFLRLSDFGKCALTAAFGAGAIAVAEIVRRRFGRRSAAAIFATGVGALYTSVWGAFRMFDLISPTAVLVLSASVTAIGIGVAMHARLAVVAVLAFLGAYVAPVLAPSGVHVPLLLPSYVLLVTSAGLALSASVERFRIMRTVCWWPTVLLGSAWMLLDEASPAMSMGFAFVVWAMFHVELFASSRREPSGEVQTARRFRWLPSPFARAVASSISTTTWAAYATAELIESVAPGQQWMGPAWYAVVAAPTAWALAGHLRWLTSVPKTESERLGVALAVQSGGLVLAAFAVGMSGWSQTLVTLIFAVSASLIGVRIRSAGVVAYGAIALGIATFRVFTVDQIEAVSLASGTNMGGLAFSWWSLLALTAAGAWWVTGRCFRATLGEGVGSIAVKICTPVAIGALAFAPLHGVSEFGWLTGWWALLGSVAFATDFVGRRNARNVTGELMLVVALALATLGSWWNDEGPMAFGLHVGASAVSLAFVGLVVLLRAEQLSRRGKAVAMPAIHRGLATAGVVVLGLSIVNIHAAQASIASGMALLNALTLAGFLWRLRLELAPVSIFVSFVATISWLVGFVTPGWRAFEAAPMLHPGLWAAIVLASGWVGTAVLAPRMQERGRVWTGEMSAVLMISAGVLAFVSTSFEFARAASIWTDVEAAERGMLSIWWGVFGVGILVAGAASGRGPLRYVGLGLLSITTFKAVLWDLAGASDVVRVASFIVLGLLLLGVSAGYLRTKKQSKHALDSGTAKPETLAPAIDDIRDPVEPRVETKLEPLS